MGAVGKEVSKVIFEIVENRYFAGFHHSSARALAVEDWAKLEQLYLGRPGHVWIKGVAGTAYAL